MRAPRFIHQHRFDLAADALLISSGLFSLVTSVMVTVMWLTGAFESGSSADQALSDSPLAAVLSLLMLGTGVVVGPALAWRLHGHDLHWRHLLALVAAPAVLGLVASLAPLLATLFDALLRPVTDWEYVGPMCVLAIVAVAYIMMLWHAVRDAMAPAGDPPMLERLRLLSLTSLAVLAFVVAGALALGYTAELGDALIFAMLMGFTAASMVLLAGVIDRFSADRALR